MFLLNTSARTRQRVLLLSWTLVALLATGCAPLLDYRAEDQAGLTADVADGDRDGHPLPEDDLPNQPEDLREDLVADPDWGGDGLTDDPDGEPDADRLDVKAPPDIAISDGSVVPDTLVVETKSPDASEISDATQHDATDSDLSDATPPPADSIIVDVGELPQPDTGDAIEADETASAPTPTSLSVTSGAITFRATGTMAVLCTSVRDNNGKLMKAIDVEFRVQSGPGTLSGASTVIVETLVSGVACAVLTLGTTPGTVNAVARVNQLSAAFVAVVLRMPDTGQTLCGMAGTFWPCADVSGPAPQDGHLIGVAKAYVEKSDQVITDSNTGISWRAAGKSPQTYADSTNACSNGTWSGYQWRLPTLRELTLLLDYGDGSPMIDSLFGLPAQSSAWTRDAGPFGLRRIVAFTLGEITVANDQALHYALCVRDTPTFTASLDDYSEIVLDGTTVVLDSSTGLMWDPQATGSWSWDSAIAVCNFSTAAGLSDWRVPTVTELASLLVTETAHDGFAHLNVFPLLADQEIWTATNDMANAGAAFLVSFADGLTHRRPKTDKYAALCVRSTSP